MTSFAKTFYLQLKGTDLQQTVVAHVAQVTATVSKVIGDVSIASCNKADSHSKAKPSAVIKAPENFLWNATGFNPNVKNIPQSRSFPTKFQGKEKEIFETHQLVFSCFSFTGDFSNNHRFVPFVLLSFTTSTHEVPWFLHDQPPNFLLSAMFRLFLIAPEISPQNCCA